MKEKPPSDITHPGEDDVLRRMLNTPPTPHVTKSALKKKAAPKKMAKEKKREP